MDGMGNEVTGFAICPTGLDFFGIGENGSQNFKFAPFPPVFSARRGEIQYCHSKKHTKDNWARRISAISDHFHHGSIYFPTFSIFICVYASNSQENTYIWLIF